MSKRFTLQEFVQDNLKKVNSRMLKEIENTLEKATHFDKLHKVHEIASPLYENLELQTSIKEATTSQSKSL